MLYKSRDIHRILTSDGKLKNRRIHLQHLESGLSDSGLCLKGTCAFEGEHLKNLFSPIVPAIYIIGTIEDAHVVHFLDRLGKIPLLIHFYRFNLTRPIREKEIISFTSHLGSFRRGYFFSEVVIHREKSIIGGISGSYRLVANSKSLFRLGGYDGV